MKSQDAHKHVLERFMEETTESRTHHNHHKTKYPKAAQAHGHQQSSANATATGLLSECHGVDVKTGADEEHLNLMSLKGLPLELCRHMGPQVASGQDMNKYSNPSSPIDNMLSFRWQMAQFLH